jgi:hypothetical protein
MIVAGYSMDLYCDGPKCTQHWDQSRETLGAIKGPWLLAAGNSDVLSMDWEIYEHDGRTRT